MKRVLPLLLAVSCASPSVRLDAGVDVLVYGATPAGIAAALAAARDGRDVLLVDPARRIGGLVTNGLSHTDFRTFEGITGAFLEFTRRVQAHYGPPEASFRGTHAEPEVNLRVFEDMLAEQPRIRVARSLRLSGASREGRRLVSAAFDDGSTRRAAFFVDASYEGDLMAAAGVEWRAGRESRSEYGESLAPEQADGQVQGYNFRLIMTRDEANRVEPAAPPGYRREDFVGVLPLFASGRLKAAFGPSPAAIYKVQIPGLPNGKADINDMSHGPVRLSMPDRSPGWVDGDAAARARIFAEHVRYNTGLLYFLQNDPEVPAAVREESRAWGWCRDEFAESGHLPEQLYVREARRMKGLRVFTERDTDPAPGDARSVFQPDAIAMGDYGPNCHGTSHDGPLYGGKHTGEFYKKVAPYQIPYGTIVPRELDNLLVPVACSASHAGFCALRLEPIWTSLGQAAGTAAALALRSGIAAQAVDVRALQRLLHAAGAATIYVGDVLPGHPDFQAVQAWGARGGLHGLSPAGQEPGERGRPITGQYFHAFPGHAAELDRPLDDALRARWSALAGRPIEARTRGEFIRRFREGRGP